MSTATLESPTATAIGWKAVCPLAEIWPWTGVCALIGEKQIAIYRYGDGEELYALGNYDPIGKAFVMSRGILGSSKGVPKVTSPLYKQGYDLRTGQCLDDPAVRLPVFAVRLRGDQVEVLA